jgi:hypothetical protein
MGLLPTKKFAFIDAGLKPKEVKRGPGRYVDCLSMYRFV